jgi:hypothetical protein
LDDTCQKPIDVGRANAAGHTGPGGAHARRFRRSMLIRVPVVHRGAMAERRTR